MQLLQYIKESIQRNNAYEMKIVTVSPLFKSNSNQTQASQLSAIPFEQWSRYFSALASARDEEQEVVRRLQPRTCLRHSHADAISV